MGERNYLTTECEALSMIYSINKFLHYLLGRKFKFHVDHSTLSYLVSKQELTGKLARWTLLLQELLVLEGCPLQALCALEQKQRQTKAFVDQHRKQKEKMFEVGKQVLVFQTKMSSKPDKLRFRWAGTFWIINKESQGTLRCRMLTQHFNVWKL